MAYPPHPAVLLPMDRRHPQWAGHLLWIASTISQVSPQGSVIWCIALTYCRKRLLLQRACQAVMAARVKFHAMVP